MDIYHSWITNTPIAHRGLHDDLLPENSLAAFQAAVEHGYAIECDVRLISDGTLVVFHDDRLSRMTDEDGYVSHLSKPDLDKIRLKDSQECIPTFDQLLRLVDGKVPILIEIKNEGAVGATEKALLDGLVGYTGEYAVQSFNPYSLEYFKRNAPHIRRGQLATQARSKGINRLKFYLLKTMRFNKRVSCPHFISYDKKYLQTSCVQCAKKQKLPVLAWTVRSQQEYDAIRQDCDNLIFEGFVPDPTTK